MQTQASCAQRARIWLRAAIAIAALVVSPLSPAANGDPYMQTILHFFPQAEEAYLTGSLLKARDGNLYGISAMGGASGGGFIYMVTPDGTYSVIHDFVANDGQSPSVGLMEGSDGYFYGITDQGGPLGHGTIYRFAPSGYFQLLHAFTAHEPNVGAGPLIEGADGRVYGTLQYGPSDVGASGAVFSMSMNGDDFVVMHAFAGPYDAGWPMSGLTIGPDGNFYGATHWRPGGDTHDVTGGSIYQMTPSGDVTLLYSFASDFSEGIEPSGVIFGSDGNLYGTTGEGGANWSGTIFRLTLQGEMTTLHAFAQGDGLPRAALIAGADGLMYGSTDAYYQSPFVYSLA
ncbi:MAG TPA: choice-of-anchor tandem repeat GloVer-containing protein, partial [Nevskiaceae bacterium]|nr:choice-of-anchor tandem repeat GloVer-containing protein [Nevskiaceae bacterium]